MIRSNELTETSSLLAGKRILVVGTGGGASGVRMVAPVQRTKALGVEIILLDTSDSSVMDEVDVHIEVDVTNTDACLLAAKEFAQTNRLDGIITFVEERTIVTSELQNALGFPGHSVWGSAASRNKHTMRKVMNENRLPSPKYAFFGNHSQAADLTKWFPFPAFLKTLDGGGAVGSRRVEAATDLVAAFDSAVDEIMTIVPHDIRRTILASFSKDHPNFLLEEYLAPAERLHVNGFGRVTIELLVQDSEILFFAIGDGTCFSATDHRYSSFGFPSQLCQEDERQFKELAERVVEVFELSNGPVIFDAVMTERGPQLYEVNARIESPLILRLVNQAYGIDLVDLALQIAVGIKIDGMIDMPAKSFILAHYLMAPEASVIHEFEIPDWPTSKKDCDITILKREGDVVLGPEAAYDCIAALEFTGPDRAAIDQRLTRLLSGISLVLAPIGSEAGPQPS